MRCTVHISHLNSVKNHLFYYDTVLINGLMCVAVGFSFVPKRTAVHERVENLLGIAPNSTSILIKGLMCVAVGFSFAPKRTAIHERMKNFLKCALKP